MEKRIREWDEYVMKMDAGRLIKISRDNIPAEEDPQAVRKDDGTT